MAGALGEIRVEGLAELTRTFRFAPKDVRLAYRKELRTVGRADPARRRERLAVERIRKIGPKWSKFRVGITQTLVYVAPRQRGLKRRDPRPGRDKANVLLGRRLANEVTNPALEQNQHRIEQDFDDMLDRLSAMWGSEVGHRRAA